LSDFARDYLIFVFVFALGVLQIAASLGRLSGLLLFRKTMPSRIAGALLILAVVVWFFASAPRNINDIDGGIAGTAQTGLFALGSFLAFAVTLVLSSILNVRLAGSKADASTDPQGFEALSESTYAKALLRSLRYWWGRWTR